MSLITDALRKVQSHPAPDPIRPAPPRPPWWTAGVALLGTGLLLWIWPFPQAASRPRAHTTPRARPRAPAPAPPIMTLMPSLPGTPPLGWTVEGIIVGMGKPTAIINGRVVEEGEELRGVKVVRVGPEQVELRRNGETVRLAVNTADR